MDNWNQRGRLPQFREMLRLEEKSESTLGQYVRAVGQFMSWLGDGALTREAAIGYKEHLAQRYRPASVNAKVAGLNRFFRFLGRPELCLKQLRIQRRPYGTQEKELSRPEYERLVRCAQSGRDRRLALVLQTICATGIRVSELKFITVESLEQGEATIRLKGKNRVILIPEKLRSRLQSFVRMAGIQSGPVFVTRTGRPLNRSNIWRAMKALGQKARVTAAKIFPHNLRKLFARSFYAVEKDIAKLADVLGHSSINTTRIYLMSTGREHRKLIDRMNLLL